MKLEGLCDDDIARYATTAVIMGGSDTNPEILFLDKEVAVRTKKCFPALGGEIMVEAERKHLAKVLRSVGGHRTKAASVLGISRKVLWEKMRDFGIEAPANDLGGAAGSAGAPEEKA